MPSEDALTVLAVPASGEAVPRTDFVRAESAVELSHGDKAGANGSTSPSSAPRTSKRFVDEDSKSPEYRSDSWRMANFKVVPCSKRYAHDWTICPFAHPGEKARRRDPRVYTYAGIACPEMKKAGFCSRGDKCPYAHNVFEFWLHPTRYRTQLCNDGTKCTRNVCFFAHTPEEMRPVPCKAAEVKRANSKGGSVSPDTPFLQPGASGLTASSTGSSDLWHMLSPEERARSSGLHSDDLPASARPQRRMPPSELIDELSSSLANVKLAMASEKRDEVITLLSKLLKDAAEDKHAAVEMAKAASMPTPQQQQHQQQFQPNRAAQLSMALSALDRSQARSLLGNTTQRDLFVDQLAKCDPEGGQDWRNIVQQILENPADASSVQQALHMNSHSHSHSHSHNVSPLSTAPAGPLDLQGNPDPSMNLGSRVLSADLNMLPPQSFWQSTGMHDLPNIPRAPSSHLPCAMSGDLDAAPHQLPPISMLDGSLFAPPRYKLAAANPSALRKQSLNLETEMPPGPPQHPRREVRRPPISAFQHAASEDWKQPVGRVPNGDLRWANSGQGGGMSSSDLATIQEGLPPLYRSADVLQCGPLETTLKRSYAPAFRSDRSKSTGLGLEPVLNLLPGPLSFPATQPGGRDTSALHSAPYDLSMAGVGEGRGSHARQSFEQRPDMNGWGGLHAQDFGSSLY